MRLSWAISQETWLLSFYLLLLGISIHLIESQNEYVNNQAPHMLQSSSRPLDEALAPFLWSPLGHCEPSLMQLCGLRLGELRLTHQ